MQKSLFGSAYNRCNVTAENGQLVLATPYDHHLVAQVKTLPYTERRYDPTRKVWLVDPKHGKLLADWIKRYFGEVISLPNLSSLKTKSVMKLLEIRYIGACKTRDDGSSTAFGMVGNNWPVIFPESVLREWFDSEPLPPTEQQTLYQVLGTKKQATPDEIKTAYRRMVRQWHPDICKEPNAHEVFLRIQEAYEILNDENKKARYDAGLALQAAFEKQNNQHNDLIQALQIVANYRSPLRCGQILVEGIEKLGRVEVTKILAWEDITKNNLTLVVSWPAGAKEPVEEWI